MKNKTLITDFTSGNIPKQLITFATPLFLSSLLQIVYNAVDMVVVGQVLGKTGISAVSVGGDVSNFLTFIAILLKMDTNTTRFIFFWQDDLFYLKNYFSFN